PSVPAKDPLAGGGSTAANNSSPASGILSPPAGQHPLSDANSGALDGADGLFLASSPFFGSGPPIANRDSFTVIHDRVAVISAPGVLGNDTDPQGLPLTAVLVTPP